MPIQNITALERQRFLDSSDPPANMRVLLLPLAQDGSTTRLCETIAGGPVALHVFEQRIVERVPSAVSATLPGKRFIERITCLAAHGQVMMDNIASIALDGLDVDMRSDLEAGVLPIGTCSRACGYCDISLPSSQRCSSACGPRLAGDPMPRRRACTPSRPPRSAHADGRDLSEGHADVAERQAPTGLHIITTLGSTVGQGETKCHNSQAPAPYDTSRHLSGPLVSSDPCR
jgi:hypothetical protein